jgi:GT2 family glycosyltransferase
MALGGFDAETLPVWFNDSDFCLRVDAQGLRVLYEPAILAIHHESKTLSSEFQPAARDAQFLAARDRFATRWGDKARSDRWFNPTYARWGTPFRYLNAPSTAASVLLR